MPSSWPSTHVAMKLSDHLTTDEVACRCGCGFGWSLNDLSFEVTKIFELIRLAVQHPLAIGSGCRCPSRNELVGGAKNSAHLRGTALDILTPYGKSRHELIVGAVLAGLVLEGLLDEAELPSTLAAVSERIRGIGVDERFVHIDVDKAVPRPAAWVYGKERRFV